jgi:hypothetical protein
VLRVLAMKAILFLVLLGGSSAVGCNAIDRAADCSQICSRYKDCIGGASYDTSGCSSRCRDNAANSSDFDHKVDVCQACVNGVSCTAAVFNCAAQCSGIVP